MILRPEVLHRLLLAKSILAAGRSSPLGQPNPHLVARQVLNAHDGADFVFAAIADQQNKLPSQGKDSMMQCLEAIDTADKHKGYFKQLNDTRNGLKHSGVLPNTSYWASVASEVFEKLSSICQATLDISLEELDESELLANAETRTHLAAAKKARASQDFKLALEEIGKALFVSLEDAPDVGGIRVGRAKAEDALKLTAFGISANDFLRLQEFLPMISGFPLVLTEKREPLEVLWKQSGFGHPGNWREDVIDFCIGTYLNVALSIQNAPPIPYAREFSDLYEYKVTAKADQLEVWEDLTDEDEHMAQIFSNNARPFRTPKRFLKKGESVIVPVHIQPLISDDLSLSGESIKRVRIAYDDMSGIGGLFSRGSERAEFVNLADVDITCVPQKWTLEQSLALPEIPWEEEPLAFRL
jgi:hypothetical protein